MNYLFCTKHITQVLFDFSQTKCREGRPSLELFSVFYCQAWLLLPQAGWRALVTIDNKWIVHVLSALFPLSLLSTLSKAAQHESEGLAEHSPPDGWDCFIRQHLHLNVA